MQEETGMKMGRKRVFILFFLLFILYIPVILSALLFGSWNIPFPELFSPSPETDLVLKVRLMRILTAFLVGGSLSLAGAVYQAVLRNVLAEPYILGISSGSALGAALAFVSKLALISVYMVPLCAAGGALAILFFVLSYGASGKGTNRLLLAGVIAGTVASSILMALVSFADSGEMSSVFWFLLGDLSAPDPQIFRFFAFFAAGTAFLLCLLAPKGNALALGEEYAWSMGVDPVKMSLLLVGLASLLAAGSVALSGIIGFVGLIIPHLIRKFDFSDNRILFPASFFSGGVFLIFCDLLSRCIFTEREIPIGVMTSLLGGPVFLWLLRNKTRVKGF